MFNYRHPRSGASEGGLGAAGQVALHPDPEDPGVRGIRGIVPGGHFLCADCVLESHLLELGFLICQNLIICPQAAQETSMAS